MDKIKFTINVEIKTITLIKKIKEIKSISSNGKIEVIFAHKGIQTIVLDINKLDQNEYDLLLERFNNLHNLKVDAIKKTRKLSI